VLAEAVDGRDARQRSLQRGHQRLWLRLRQQQHAGRQHLATMHGTGAVCRTVRARRLSLACWYGTISKFLLAEIADVLCPFVEACLPSKHMPFFMRTHLNIGAVCMTFLLVKHCTRPEHASGTPPTRVDTTSSPAAAASTSAMQKASVSDVFRNTRPRASTPGTCATWLGVCGLTLGSLPV